MLVRRMEKLEKITCISTLSAVKEERLPYGCEWHWRRPGWATPCRQRDEDRTEEGSKSETGSHVDILLCAHPTITLVERTGIARATPRTPRVGQKANNTSSSTKWQEFSLRAAQTVARQICRQRPASWIPDACAQGAPRLR